MEILSTFISSAIGCGIGLLIVRFILMPYKFNQSESTESGLKIFCKCTNNINTNESCKADFYDANKHGHVLYVCDRCGQEYDFNLDMGPFAMENENPISYQEYLANKSLYDKYTKEVTGA